MIMFSYWNKFCDLNEIALLQTQTTGEFNKISAQRFYCLTGGGEKMFNRSLCPAGICGYLNLLASFI